MKTTTPLTNYCSGQRGRRLIHYEDKLASYRDDDENDDNDGNETDTAAAEEDD